MNSQTIKFSGADTLLQTLQGISASVRAEILGPAVVAAAKPIQIAIRGFAPRATGALAESIAIKGIANKYTGTAAALIGPSLEAVRKQLGLSHAGWRAHRKEHPVDTPVRYAHLIEYGHIIAKGGSLTPQYNLVRTLVVTKKGKTVARFKRGTIKTEAKGHAGGFVLARPFMRPGLAAGAPAAGEILVQKVGEGIERVRARLVAKGEHVT